MLLCWLWFSLSVFGVTGKRKCSGQFPGSCSPHDFFPLLSHTCVPRSSVSQTEGRIWLLTGLDITRNVRPTRARSRDEEKLKWGFLMRLEFPTPVSVWIMVFWDMNLCSLVYGYRCFGRTFFLSSRCCFITTLCRVTAFYSVFLSFFFVVPICFTFILIYSGNAKKLRNRIYVAYIERTSPATRNVLPFVYIM
jgi:hypothetical protein